MSRLHRSHYLLVGKSGVELDIWVVRNGDWSVGPSADDDQSRPAPDAVGQAPESIHQYVETFPDCLVACE